MSAMQMNGHEKIPICNKEVEQEQFEDSDMQQLPQLYKQIKDEQTRLKPQSLALFQQLVSKVYKLKVNISNLRLSDKDMQISISPADIQSIINKVLLETCQTHRKLIDEQMKFARGMQSTQCFYKVDAESAGVGYFDRVFDQSKVNQGTKEDGSSASNKLRVNQNFYSYCVWVIYSHYCSLCQCNQQIYRLAKIFREDSEKLYYRILNEIESKKILDTDDLQSFNNQFMGKNQNSFKQLFNTDDIDQKISKVQDYQIVKITQLNILTIVNLIPPSLPKIQNIRFLRSYDNQKNLQNTNILYWHVCSFQATINSIIKDSRQNMEKFAGSYLQNFQKAIVVLKGRLSMTGDVYATQNEILQYPKVKERKRLQSCKLFDNQLTQSEIEKNFDKERQMDEFAQQQKLRLDQQAQLVKNIDNLIKKQRQNNGKRIQRTQSVKQSKNKKVNEQVCIQTKKITNSKIVNSYIYKRSSIETAQKIQSFTRVSATLQSNKQSYKFQFVVKKSSNIERQADNQYQADEIQERKKLKSMMMSQEKLSRSLHGDITQQLKSTLSNKIRSREEQFANYLRITDRYQKYKKGLKDNDELNLHEFLQQNNFKNEDQESQNDEAYLQRMEEQHSKTERKKKKKKNKKKKNKEDVKNQSNIQGGSLQLKPSVNKQTQIEGTKIISSNIQNQVSEKQLQIIKALWNTKIDDKTRLKCFQIDNQIFAQMKIRQNDNLEKYTFRSEPSPMKIKNKVKKRRAA